MTFTQIMRQYNRRAILTLLAYDNDYRLSADMIVDGLRANGQTITHDQLLSEMHWLAEQGFITLTTIAVLTIATLTDRGLDIARGQTRAPGIRDLRPSEIHEMSKQ